MTKVIIVLFVIVCGCFKADFSNWSIPKDKVKDGFGTGGFFPYGVVGVMRGASTAFFGYIGFDAITSAGEEAKTPWKSIPLSICLSLFTVFVCYVGVSSVLTLMVPYYNLVSNFLECFI